MTITEKENANYTMKVDFVNFDYFFSAMSAIPGHKHKVWANITMTDKNTGEIVWVVEVDEFIGDRDFVRYDSYTKMMTGLGERIARLK